MNIEDITKKVRDLHLSPNFVANETDTQLIADIMKDSPNTPLEELISDAVRVDSITGRLIQEGYCFHGGEFYCTEETEADRYAKQCGYNSWQDAYESDTQCYYTEWGE